MKATTSFFVFILLLSILPQTYSLSKTSVFGVILGCICPHLPAFSRIRTEYGEIYFSESILLVKLLEYILVFKGGTIKLFCYEQDFRLYCEYLFVHLINKLKIYLCSNSPVLNGRLLFWHDSSRPHVSSWNLPF